MRKANPRTSMWSYAELVSTTPMPLVNQAQWKATASHNPEAAANGINGEGTTRWESGVAQAPGMWFQIELPQPVNVAEIIVDALAGGRGGFGFGRGRGGALSSGPLASYSVQVSMDGAAWSEPVAEGQGQNPTTTIAIKPVPARFVRITQTGTPATAAQWAIQRVRIFSLGSSRVEALTAMALQSINPATGETLQTFDTLAPAEVMDRLARATASFRAWKNTPFGERARLLVRAAAILESESEALGRLMTLEMGKPVRAGIDEAVKCARGCRYYAEHAARFLADEDVPHRGDARATSATSRSASVLAVMPWNFPFWQVFRFAAPALMAGQRRAAQARLERAAVRAGDRRHLPARGLSRRRLPDAADRFGGRGARSSTTRASPRSR